MKYNKYVKEELKKLEQVMYDLDIAILEMQDERQDIYDDRSEKWQESSKGEEYEEACRPKLAEMLVFY